MNALSPMLDTAALLELLDAWVARGWLRDIDLAFTRFLRDECPAADPALLLAAALVSHQLGRGHVCLDLAATLEDPWMALSLPPEQATPTDDDPLPQPRDLLRQLTLADWTARLDLPDAVGTGAGRTPLVRVAHRLYLRRYWTYERQVEAAITQRSADNTTLSEGLPKAAFRSTLAQLFPAAAADGCDWQKIACAQAARSAFSIITGGPGTGKTTTVVRLLALLQSLALAPEGGRPLDIRLAAPTGKAAARLKESIAGAIGKLPADMLGDIMGQPGLRAAIPSEVTTLHRLLGTLPDSRRFRHDARNPLPLDVLVVDEASMIDLEMMAALLTALPADARLILLGDQDQLASVEAGSVLGELCRRARQGHYTPATARHIADLSGQRIPDELIDPDGQPLDQHIIMLRQSYRFTAASGIGRLAAAINAGSTPAIAGLWAAPPADIARHHLPRLDDERLERILIGEPETGKDEPKGYAHYLHLIASQRPELDAGPAAFDAWARKVLAAHGEFQLLAALRNGPFGVAGLNQRIEALLKKRGLIHPGPLHGTPGESDWYSGRPVLVTRNDYRLGLMNGDIGITLPCPLADRHTGQLQWSLRVAFPKTDGSGGIHWILPSRLQAVETVFALTVHKSQGSEFDHCALLLPPERNPILTRELVYTGITRARQWFSLITIANPAILNEAAERTVQRSGGLFLADLA